MQILLIHQYFLQEGEGGGSRWNETARICKNKGHDVIVMTGNQHYLKASGNKLYHGKFHETVNADGVRVFSCPVYRFTGRAFLFKRLLEYFSFSFVVLYCGIFIWRQRPDLIIATSPPLTVSMAAMVLSWWKRCPYVAEIRDLWPESAMDLKVLTNPLLIRAALWLERLFYKNARLIVVLTPAFKEVLQTKKNIASEKLLYIPNAVDFSLADRIVSEFDERLLRKELSLNTHFIITYVGAHGRANGLEILLKIAPSLKSLPVCFLLIGDGDQKEILKQKVVESGLDNIKFLDLMPKNEVLKYILISDLGLTILQKNETFKTIYSNKTFDYFSCRKPVLMGVDGISRELVEKADAGMYIDSEDPSSWDSAIKLYLSNPERAVRQGENGYHYAKKHFDRKYWAEIYLENIEKLLT